MQERIQNLKQDTLDYIHERQQWICEAVEVVTGDESLNPLEVLPEPGEVRADSEPMDLSAEQEAELREIAGRFGLGGEVDVSTTAETVIVEGGKPWKIEAEIAIVDNPKSIVIAGSPYRKIGSDEQDYLREKFGLDETDMSEYQMAAQIIELQEGFVPLEESEVLPFGYDITNGHELVHEATGQMVVIGHVGDRPVVHFRIDRENYTDEVGQQKYRNQPDSAAVMGIVSDVLTATGDETSSVGMVTSNTYASRVIDAKRAGLKHGRNFEVGMYGRQTLADVKGEPVAAPTAIEQIPGELHVMYKKSQQLKSEL